MQSVKVSEKFQIVVPSSVRRQLGIRRGDRLLVEIRGEQILLRRAPNDYAAELAGLHADVWEGVDPSEYIRRERDASSR